MSRFIVRKVAVLGAGVMGAQIAAHLVNCKVPVVLFDLPAEGRAEERHRAEGHRQPEEAESGAARRPEDAALIQPANYEEHLELLGDATWSSRRSPSAWTGSSTCTPRSRRTCRRMRSLASNTSGLSITKLSEALPEAIKPRFCGMHFFNPPRYMPLVELIDTPTTEPRVLDELEAFVTTTWARAWCGPRTRPTSSPTASASPACWPPSRKPRNSA